MNAEMNKPGWFLHLTEIFRAIYEYFQGYFFIRKTIKSEEGAGETVLVIPGLLSTDIYTVPLRNFLNKIGYKTVGWEMGRNLGRLEYLPKLQEKVKELYLQNNQKVIVIGWSMGGILARELAKLSPEFIKMVITTGSPFADVQAPNHAKWVYDLLNKNQEIDPHFENQIPVPPSMPTLALYSKLDGMVPWQACMDLNPDELHQNQEVSSSHFGMGGNREVMTAIRKFIEKKELIEQV
ncbi:MAG: alpha/beta fold hydrolase [Bacteroidota bacterium]